MVSPTKSGSDRCREALCAHPPYGVCGAISWVGARQAPRQRGGAPYFRRHLWYPRHPPGFAAVRARENRRRSRPVVGWRPAPECRPIRPASHGSRLPGSPKSGTFSPPHAQRNGLRLPGCDNRVAGHEALRLHASCAWHRPSATDEAQDQVPGRRCPHRPASRFQSGR